MDDTVIKVGGMSCGGCVKSVTNVLQGLEGVQKAEVSLEKGEARVAYDAGRVARDQMLQAIAEAGFDAA
ncbi:MAG TPA: cation transporter [Rhodocyclaceae bacterium]|nr:cation transporter [Rhodocyclaceae bacterium]HNH34546.1 cation transporter [Rhodocyclaceae bacterium]